MRSILVHVHEDSGLRARVQVALDLAREFDAHLTFLQPVPLDFAMPGDLYGTMIAEMLPVLQEQADKLRDEIGGRLANEDVRWDWRQERGPTRAVVQEAEGLADLVVLGTRDPENSSEGPSALTGSMAVHGRSPVLIVPDGVHQFDPCGIAVVGWNGSVEAAHALRATVPFLRKAKAVTLIEVAERRDEETWLSATEAAEYLSRHEVSCKIDTVEYDETTVAQALLEAAHARNAEYLVSGAYGHSRAIEAVFGGVTRKLLVDPPLPVFLAH